MAKKTDRPRTWRPTSSALFARAPRNGRKTVKSEERSPASRSYRHARMTRERGVSVKEAAAQIMEKAYLQGERQRPASGQRASDHVRGSAAHPEGDRQAARTTAYFTQTLLPDYIEENGLDWDVGYDARGHFSEPHDGEVFGVGTLEVRDYLAGFARAADSSMPRSAKQKLNSAAQPGISARCCSLKNKASIHC